MGPMVLRGIWGEGSFIFRDFGRRVISLQGAGGQTQIFREQEFEKYKGAGVIFLSRSRELRSPPPDRASMI